MKTIHRLRKVQFSAVLLFLFLLSPPGLSNALMPLNDNGLSQNSPSLVDQSDDSGLKQINEKQLEDLSPSLTDPKQKNTIASQPDISLEFQNSICFKQCHNKNDFRPNDNTAKQWRLLIEKNGHSIFSDIPWESPEQKQNILNYLLENAKNSKPDSAGIGVW